ncbi:NTP transferase domain-containing protein [Candidatus Gracilibacteria bacterium]|nr:NTP transferase domain-containing protein [Candidatus Gracilibacteria bacterium]
MKVLVLAAGRSTRMAPLGDKNFLDFMGKPLLARQLEMLEGFGEIIVVGGAHNLEAIRELGGKGCGAKRFRCRYVWSCFGGQGSVGGGACFDF